MLSKKELEKIRKMCNSQGNNLSISFEFEGMDITNPFLDDTGRFEVDPVEYYGQAFLQSDFVKAVKK